MVRAICGLRIDVMILAAVKTLRSSRMPSDNLDQAAVNDKEMYILD